MASSSIDPLGGRGGHFIVVFGVGGGPFGTSAGVAAMASSSHDHPHTEEHVELVWALPDTGAGEQQLPQLRQSGHGMKRMRLRPDTIWIMMN